MKILTIGKGQLAMLLASAAHKQQHQLLAWDLRTEQAYDFSNHVWVPGNFDLCCQQADVITAELEDITPLGNALEPYHAKMFPSANALLSLAFRDTEKAVMDSLGIPHAATAQVSDIAQLMRALEALDHKAVIKAVRSGYDGKGQWRSHTKEDLPHLLDQIEQFWRQCPDISLVVERFVPFTAEVSIIGSRDRHGRVAFFPLTTNFHDGGILQISLAGMPFPWSYLQSKAEAVFKRLTDALDYVGTLAIEFFVEGRELVVNEIAPRVHNSGHWTTDGADISQFDNHIAAITGQAVSAPHQVKPTIMLNVIGQPNIDPHLLNAPEVRCYWYEKSLRPGRKMGHINIAAESTRDLLDLLEKYNPYWPDNVKSTLQEAKTLLRAS